MNTEKTVTNFDMVPLWYCRAALDELESFWDTAQELHVSPVTTLYDLVKERNDRTKQRNI